MRNIVLGFSILVTSVRTQDFTPTLSTTCLDGVITATVQTQTPFAGIIYADEHRQECNTIGTGLLSTRIQMALTDLELCGITYMQEDESYFVVVHVREHSMIILEQDRTFNISCSHPGHTSGDQRTIDPIKMGLYSELGKVHKTLFGDSYVVHISSESDSDFVVGRCIGFSGRNNSLELTDSQGCTTNSEILTNFVYDFHTKSATAELKSMFKFPNFNTIHLQCAVVYCAENCVNVDCERRRDDPFPDYDDSPRQQRIIDTHYASTTVRVSEVGERIELSHVAQCAYYYQLMSALCIIFACLFLVSMGVNCLFCALAGICAEPRNDIVQPNSQLDAYSKGILHYPSISWPDTVVADRASVSSQIRNMGALTPRNSLQISPSSSGGSSDRALIDPERRSPPAPPPRAPTTTLTVHKL